MRSPKSIEMRPRNSKQSKGLLERSPRHQGQKMKNLRMVEMLMWRSSGKICWELRKRWLN